MRFTLSILITLIIFTGCRKEYASPAPLVYFEKNYGGSAEDQGRSLIISDSGIVLIGNSKSFGAVGMGMYLIKIDHSGNFLWQKLIDGIFTGEELRNGVEVSDGYIVVGYTNSNDLGVTVNGLDVYLAKIDKNSGAIIWQKTFGGSNSQYAYSIKKTSDNHLLIVGNENYEKIYSLKTDLNGNILWEKRFDFGSSNEVARDIIELSDGNYALCGFTASIGNGNEDVFLMKIDTNGNKLWFRNFGGALKDEAYSIAEDKEGNLYIGGSAQISGRGTDYYLIKTDSSGNEIWSKTFGGYLDDEGQSLVINSKNQVLFAGNSESYGAGETDVYVMKIESNGSKIWEKTYGNTEYDTARKIKLLDDSTYLITGYTKLINDDGSENKQIYLIKASDSLTNF